MSKDAMNLQVLKRHDKDALSIDDTSSHVVVYDFEQESSKWSKRGIEGSLFLYERSSSPRYAFTIMNRLGVENLTIYCTGDLEVSHQGDYVIMKNNADEEITGLWMYEESDRPRLAEKLASFAQKHAPYPHQHHHHHHQQAPAQQARPQQSRQQPHQAPQRLTPAQKYAATRQQALAQQQAPVRQIPHQAPVQDVTSRQQPHPQQHQQQQYPQHQHPQQQQFQQIDVMNMLQTASAKYEGSPPQHNSQPAPPQFPVQSLNDVYDRLDICFMPPHNKDYPMNRNDFSSRLGSEFC